MISKEELELLQGELAHAERNGRTYYEMPVRVLKELIAMRTVEIAKPTEERECQSDSCSTSIDKFKENKGLFHEC
jgi:hypothetical protein